MSDSTLLPNLFVIGAPRCGTTSLHDWLVAHPTIGGCSVKEPFYLADRDSSEFVPQRNFHDHGWAGYESLLSHCRDASLRLESTTGYLYGETALRELSRLSPIPRFVVVLREPVSRLVSTYRYFIGHKGAIPEGWSFSDFVEAVDGGDERIASNEFLRDAFDQGCYARHLDRWRAAVGAGQIQILLLEQMQRSPQLVVPELVRWCGVDGGWYDRYDWPHRNESYSLKFPRLHRWVRQKLLPLVKNDAMKRRLRPLYVRFAGGKERPLSERDRLTMEQLRERYSEPNERLAREWAIDLSLWGRRR